MAADDWEDVTEWGVGGLISDKFVVICLKSSGWV